jgi:glycosyltransferase involved in cell wall biosynthesis
VKVVFCTPSLAGPTAPYIKALEESIPLIVGAGWEEAYAQEVGCPYISHARATMTRKALDAGADVIVYLDYDLSWDPKDLLTLLETPGDVVAGTYRFKKDEEEYMGAVCELNGSPACRASDGAVKAQRIPAGFLKVTRQAIRHFMAKYPELMYGPVESPSIDLFNHGAHKGAWYGEDYAFSRNWVDAGGDIWIVPDLNITHHGKDAEGKPKAFPGNFHRYLSQMPKETP